LLIFKRTKKIKIIFFAVNSFPVFVFIKYGSYKNSMKCNNVLSIPIYVGKAVKAGGLRKGHLVK